MVSVHATDLDPLEADNTGLQNLLNGSCAHPADTRPVHLETYEIFKVWANEAFNGAFPKTTSPRYTSAYALLLYWSEDDLGVATEAACLQRVFEDEYNFETNTYLIPSIDSEQLLVQRIFEFRKKHAAPEYLSYTMAATQSKLNTIIAYGEGLLSPPYRLSSY